MVVVASYCSTAGKPVRDEGEMDGAKYRTILLHSLRDVRLGAELHFPIGQCP